MVQFLLMIFLTAIAINGIYNITRGEWIVKPDGTKEWVGKIGKFFLKFLEQHVVGFEFYKGEESIKQLAKVKEYFKDDDIIGIFDEGVILKKMNEKKTAFFFAFASTKNVLISLNKYVENEGDPEKFDKMILSFYKEVKKYKFPFWVREPLGMCITCMASFWGTVFFILWYIVAMNVQSDAAKALLQLPFSLKVLLWGIFCISLAWANEIVFNINDYLKEKR